jgi:radical SAM protein with 4Fe4S-binding SPASM domain
MGIKEKLEDFILLLGKNNKWLSPFYIRKAFSVLFYSILGSKNASNYGPLRLQIEITDKCNFDCIMCDRHNLKNIRALKNEISFKKFKHLIEKIKPLYLTLNGLGEPLLNTKLFKFLELCNKKKITTSMPTNMSLMNETNIERLINNPPSILTFSFHGTTPSSFNSITQSSSFKHCLNNFETLVSKIDRKRTDLRILCVLQSKNLEEYNAMFLYLKKWDLLHSFRLEPVFDFVPNHDCLPSKGQIEQVLKKLNTDIKQEKEPEKKSFLLNWKSKILELYKRRDLHMRAPCLTPWISTYITATGKVLPCCYLTSEKYVMGNINKTPFMEIWNGKNYQIFRSLLIHSRKNIKECYRCFWNDASRVNMYRLFLLGYSRWEGKKDSGKIV